MWGYNESGRTWHLVCRLGKIACQRRELSMTSWSEQKPSPLPPDRLCRSCAHAVARSAKWVKRDPRLAARIADQYPSGCFSISE